MKPRLRKPWDSSSVPNLPEEPDQESKKECGCQKAQKRGITEPALALTIHPCLQQGTRPKARTAQPWRHKSHVDEGSRPSQISLMTHDQLLPLIHSSVGQLPTTSQSWKENGQVRYSSCVNDYIDIDIGIQHIYISSVNWYPDNCFCFDSYWKWRLAFRC